MREFSYSTFTRKQANVLYAAVKRGELSMGKKDISRMYDLVNANSLDTDERVLRGHLERAIGHLVEGRTEFAQAELDGKTVRRERVVVGTRTRRATEDDFFYELGEEIVEKIEEERWAIA